MTCDSHLGTRLEWSWSDCLASTASWTVLGLSAEVNLMYCERRVREGVTQTRGIDRTRLIQLGLGEEERVREIIYEGQTRGKVVEWSRESVKGLGGMSETYFTMKVETVKHVCHTFEMFPEFFPNSPDVCWFIILYRRLGFQIHHLLTTLRSS